VKCGYPRIDGCPEGSSDYLRRRLESSVQIESSSEWFSGHFDEYPIAPGVALLALAAETVKRQGREQGRLLEVSGFFGIRFRRLVLPGEELLISVVPCPLSLRQNSIFM